MDQLTASRHADRIRELNQTWVAAAQERDLDAMMAIYSLDAQELLPGKVGMISGLFFGLAFGTAGIAAALLGELADYTSISFVYRACAFMPLLGLLTVFLPNFKTKK